LKGEASSKGIGFEIARGADSVTFEGGGVRDERD
jgi:hypothetical protein